LSADEVHRAFDLSEQLRNVDAIFARVFGGGADRVAAVPARAEVHG
jgi:hypothetical protein